MEKPTKKPQKSVLNWNECVRYLEHKYKIDIRDYKGRFKGGKHNPDVEYCDFWHWFLDHNDIHNGCYAYLGFDWLDDTKTPDWIKEIITLFKNEFFEGDDLEFWVEW